VDNGKPMRETLNADIPLTIDHFRYFAGCLRAQEGGISEIDEHTVAYHFHEPLGVVGQIIPWNFPILMAAWKLAPAIGAGNCVVLKPAESTPISILILAGLIADLLPPGVLNIVNGYGREAGLPLATSRRIAKIAFTGSTTTGRVIAQAAANNFIPATLELGGKSPNIFYYLDLGRQEGAELLIGGERAHLGGDLEDGYYVQPTLFKGHNKMRIFQEEIFGPVLAVTTFKDEAEALEIANDTLYGLGRTTENGIGPLTRADAIAAIALLLPFLYFFFPACHAASETRTCLGTSFNS
jgi:acyl-CoA reductase-like NAD-dependent aldehyde dehydrogenase